MKKKKMANKRTYECLSAMYFEITIDFEFEMLEEDVRAAATALAFNEASVSAVFFNFGLYH